MHGATRQRNAEDGSRERWPLGTYQPESIELVRRYGPLFLNRADYERRLAVAVVEYVSFLARRADRLRDGDFLSYHRRVFADLKRTLDLSGVLRDGLLQFRRMITGG